MWSPTAYDKHHKLWIRAIRCVSGPAETIQLYPTCSMVGRVTVRKQVVPANLGPLIAQLSNSGQSSDGAKRIRRLITRRHACVFSLHMKLDAIDALYNVIRCFILLRIVPPSFHVSQIFRRGSFPAWTG